MILKEFYRYEQYLQSGRTILPETTSVRTVGESTRSLPRVVLAGQEIEI